MMSPSSLRQLPGPPTHDVQTFETLPAVQAPAWIAHPRLGPETERVRQVLSGSTAETLAGQAFLKASGHGGIDPMTDAQMKSLDSYADQVKSLKRVRK